ncbi:tumor necrosis factor ligand superfamily member 15-like isoform X2 [Trematomus bernacchii]|uniref:tumor necrosis factor ligand superfamily member 15-like isoform X2 n=1 Tax=Trematomus bernacchii TaxID=40690 RepID=UPI00146E9036|nr:tumor necrosis factor ligand superfamily member 15-like isoform X2 [Trematomus bernacchii]
MEAERYCCCCCGGEGALQPLSLVQPAPRRQTRHPAMAQCVTVGLLLLILAALALLLTVVLGGRGHPVSPDSQPERQASGGSFEQQQQKNSGHPSAMLTAPKGNKTDGYYLLWESDAGNAFCSGGFIYSGGSLVVPRAGLYRVFLQITYESKSHFDCNLRLNSTVFVLQKSYNDYQPLLMSEDTVSKKLKRWNKSLYTAGLFFLEADSRLRVTSSCQELIVGNEDRVFFGADLLPQ